MTGLEKILAEIREEAAAEAAEVTRKAQQEAEGVLADAKIESDAKIARIEAAARQDVADIKASRDSAEALQRRQKTLATKQALLAETLQKALDTLYALPDKEYFALLEKLAVKNAQPGEGEILLNEKDRARLPWGTGLVLAVSLPKGCKLSVSKETRPIDGGFVLKYGDVEQNCSFQAIFDARADEFSDLVRDVLFAG